MLSNVKIKRGEDEDYEEPELKLAKPVSDDELKELVTVGAKTNDSSLDEFEFDAEDDDDFFSED